jgi:ribosome biogenesis GTPase
MTLKDLGLDDRLLENYKEHLKPEDNLARVVAVHKDNCTIRNEENELPAEVTGKLLFEAESALDLPAVGDWIAVQYYNQNTLAIIHKVMPRRSFLRRKTAGKKIEYQPIAANIDVAFIVQSVDVDFNLPRLERYLIMANQSRITPVILLSKRDLVSAQDLEQMILEVRDRNPDSGIIAFSNTTGEGLDEIQKMIKPGRTYCLLGSSGVGKTTLINRLIGEDTLATEAVRDRNGKGKHITTRRQLIILEQGGMIIDNPGMRELGNIGVQEGLDETFKEIALLAQTCRYKDCTHREEPGCSVVQAVKDGKLDEKKYHNYLKIRKETEYYEMSYLEKRQKDRKFGQFIKKHKKIFDKNRT